MKINLNLLLKKDKAKLSLIDKNLRPGTIDIATWCNTFQLTLAVQLSMSRDFDSHQVSHTHVL